MKIIGIPEDRLFVFNHAVQEFPASRQAILEDLIRLRTTIKPTLVFMLSLGDIHQDHLTIAQEGLRAFKRCTVLCYEDPWNNFSFNNQVFVSLAERQLKKKTDAIYADVSQRGRDYTAPDFTRSLAHARGVQVSVPYAEALESPRIVL